MGESSWDILQNESVSVLALDRCECQTRSGGSRGGVWSQGFLVKNSSENVFGADWMSTPLLFAIAQVE
jgi:hypothetical protein